MASASLLSSGSRWKNADQTACDERAQYREDLSHGVCSWNLDELLSLSTAEELQSWVPRCRRRICGHEDRMASTSTRAAVWPLIVTAAVPDCPGLTGSLAPSGLMSHRR